MKLHKSAYLVLGMIAAGHGSGYEISKVAALASRFFWAAGDGQVYPQLRRLAELELIEGRSEARGEREKKVYSLTDAGRAVLQSWLASTEPPMWELRDEGLLKLFFADELDVAGLRALLAVVRLMHADTLERLTQTPATPSVGPRLALSHGLALHRAAVKWCDEVDAQLAGCDAATAAGEALATIV